MDLFKPFFKPEETPDVSNLYAASRKELKCLLEKFADPDLSEMHIQNSQSILCTDTNGKSYVEEYYLTSIRNLIECCAIQSNTRIDPIFPIAGGQLPEQGIRWHAALKEVTFHNDLLNFRKHRFASISIDDFSLDESQLEKLQNAVACSHPILMFGATGSGKTSFLNAVLRHFFHGVRLGILETIPEIEIVSEYWFRLAVRAENSQRQGKITLQKLAQELLRLRPERIVVGEIRGVEALSFLESSTSGHGGAISTIHACTPDEALMRLVHFARNSSLKNGTRPLEILKMFSMTKLLLVGLHQRKCCYIKSMAV